jgi:hypothetical protein
MHSDIIEYLNSPAPKVCELNESPFLCEFWGPDELDTFNREYEVLQYAPGHFGFATSGGGEMYAIDPCGKIVCLPFIGMEPSAALVIANDWPTFLTKLRPIQL